MHTAAPPSRKRFGFGSFIGLGLTGLLAINTGCGGGSGTTNPPPAPPTSSTALSGRSAKGIIQNGVVTAYEWSAGAWVKRGEANTDGRGDYSLNLSGYSGNAVRLVISAASGTTMIWDGPTGGAHTFGQAEALPSGFAMQAVLPPLVSSSVTNVPITPYTSMAAALVEAASTKDAVSVQKAIATINVITGFDVARTKVVDITSQTAMNGASTAEQRASAMTAALTFIPGQTLTELVTRLSQSLADGKFDASDAIKVGDLTKAWTDALASAGIASRLSDAVKNEIRVAAQIVNDATDGSGTFIPNPPANPPTTEIAAAKGLISDARSLVSNIIQTDFQTPLGATGIKAEAAASVFNRDAAAMAQILGISLQQAMTQVGTVDEIRTAVIRDGSAQKIITITSGISTLGTLTLTASNASSLKMQLSGSLKGTEPGARTVTVNATIDTGMDLSKFNWTTVTTTQTSTQISLQASVGDGTTSLAISKGTISVTVEPGTGGKPVVTALALTDLTLGLVTQNASFTGSTTLELVKLTDAAPVSTYFHEDDRLSLKKASLSGTFSLGSGETFKANAGLDLANADTFDLLAFLNSNQVVFMWAENVLTPAQIQAIKIAGGLSNVTGDWGVYYYVNPDWNSQGAYAWGGNTGGNPDPATLLAVYNPDTYLLNQFKANAGATVRGRQVYVGNFNGITSSSISGRVQLPGFAETATNFMKLSMTMGFELTGVAGLPAAKVALAASRSTLNGGSASIGVTWGTSQYTFTFSDIDIAARTGSLTITNGQGVSLQLKDINAGAATGALYVGTTKAADVKQLQSGLIKVSYTDGTFETLQ